MSGSKKKINPAILLPFILAFVSKFLSEEKLKALVDKSISIKK